MLEKFYNDKQTFAFPFQIMVFLSRISLIKNTRDNNPDAIIVMERSPYTDRHVFVQMLYDSGMIDEICMKIYTMWFDHFIKEYQINKIIYVNTQPMKCKERVDIRSRIGEDKIAQEYLVNCDTYHNQMISKFDPKMVLNINGNQDYDNDGKIINEWINYLNDNLFNIIH